MRKSKLFTTICFCAALTINAEFANAKLQMTQELLGEFVETAINAKEGSDASVENLKRLLNEMEVKDIADASYILGRTYLNGENLHFVDLPIGSDLEEAKYWLTKASDLGQPKAKILLSRMYERGQGGEKDINRANMLKAEAASLDFQDVAKGTGFFVNKYNILTNSHVVQNCKSITVKNPNTKSEYSARLVKASDDEDLAILQTENANQSFAKFTNDELKESDRVYLSGFNADEHKYSMTFVNEPNQRTVLKVPGASNTRMLKRIKFDRNNEIGNGDSGAPLLNKYGSVVGVMDSKDSEAGHNVGMFDTPLANAIPAKHIFKFFDQNKISYLKVNDTDVIDEAYENVAGGFTCEVICNK